MTIEEKRLAKNARAARRRAAKKAPAQVSLSDRVNEIHTAMEGVLSYLSDRWRDGAEYEELSEYAKAIQTKLPKGATVTRMTRRPFGFHFIFEGATIHFFITARKYGWKRIA